MPIKKSLEHVVLPRNPLARIMRYYLYFAQDEAGPSSPIIQIKTIRLWKIKMKIRSTLLAFGIAATLTGCQNMDSNALLSSGAEAFGPTLLATNR